MSFQRGFTLVELMIVVAIIGILASIATPNFIKMQYSSKRAESPLVVSGIKTAEIAYESKADAFLAVGAYPTGDPDKSPHKWNGGNVGFQKLGWIPDGDLRGQYSVTTSTSDFTVNGVTDVDGDNNDSVYTATRSISVVFLNANDTY